MSGRGRLSAERPTFFEGNPRIAWEGSNAGLGNARRQVGSLSTAGLPASGGAVEAKLSKLAHLRRGAPLAPKADQAFGCEPHPSGGCQSAVAPNSLVRNRILTCSIML